MPYAGYSGDIIHIVASFLWKIDILYPEFTEFHRRIIGILSRGDIFAAYNKAIINRSPAKVWRRNNNPGGGNFFTGGDSLEESKIPILVGAAQYRQEKDVAKPLDPLGLMVEASRRALSDSGAPRLEDLIDRAYVVNLFQWPYRDVPGMLAERLGIAPREKFYTAVGGNTPQVLVNRAARSLASGECRAVLMTGAEAFYALRRALKGEVVLDWPESEPPERIEGDNRPGISEIESRYDLFLPSYM
ncbi:MAG: hypothetical protein JRD89_13055, partial [Deltaproteobacteria bacterium]|nr:hypothetical protein [Deltaproteobacteria bacterium]